jgi:hypothetical protein
VFVLLALPATALALATESIGNAPAAKQPEWADGVVDVVNLKTRVYSQWVNGNENFYYRGNAQAVSEALGQYAKVRANIREVVLLPGTPQVKSFGGKAIDFDWKLHVPSGIYLAGAKHKHAVMTVYVGALKPRPLERKLVDQWLQDLNSDAFKTRDAAQQALQKLGNDAKPFLRQALKNPPTLEARRRLESLLEKLAPLDVGDLEVPQGVTVITVDDLLAQGFKDLEDPDRNARSFAIQELRRLAVYSDKVVPALVDLFKKDKDDHVRRVAAACLSSICVEMKTAVPLLKQGLDDPDAYIRHAFQTALERLQNVKDSPAEDERIRRERAIVQEINALKKTAAK